MMVAVRRGDIAQNLGGRADAMQMLWPRRIDRRVVLQQNSDGLVGLGRSLRAGDRPRAAERERRHNAGKQHGVARWQQDDCTLRQFQLWGIARRARGLCGSLARPGRRLRGFR
jgi:hypothetical protein